jgi:hypothetical protein
LKTFLDLVVGESPRATAASTRDHRRRE